MSNIHDYKYCYEWRKVTKRNELWMQLPTELIDKIAKECILLWMQPSGHQGNFSRIDNFYLPKKKHYIPFALFPAERQPTGSTWSWK